MVIASSISLWGDKKEWTKEELISQLKPMCKLAKPRLLFPTDLHSFERIQTVLVFITTDILSFTGS
jgi:hypothetical protein